jgi:hypothetical protein
MPNNSFKPTPCRGVGHVLCATLARVRRPATGRLNSGVRRLRMKYRYLILMTAVLSVSPNVAYASDPTGLAILFYFFAAAIFIPYYALWRWFSSSIKRKTLRQFTQIFGISLYWAPFSNGSALWPAWAALFQREYWGYALLSVVVTTGMIFTIFRLFVRARGKDA